MIHVQLIGKDSAKLQPLLRAAIQEGRIKAFEVAQVKGGLKLQHRKFVGSITFSQKRGILLATLKCHDKQREWQLLESFVGRMTYHFRDEMAAINIQFE